MKPPLKYPYMWEFYQDDPNLETPAELERLDVFLRRRRNKVACNSVLMADGFLTAFVVVPPFTPMPPGFGIHSVWGRKSDALWPDGIWSLEERKMNRILENRITSIHFTLSESWTDYGHLIRTPNPNASQLVTWSRGFMRGLSCLDRKAWGSIFNHGHSRALIAPFIYLGCKNGWTSDVDAKHDLGQQLVKISFHFSGLVKSIMEYYRSLHYSKQMMDVQAGLSSHWNVPTRATHIVW